MPAIFQWRNVSHDWVQVQNKTPWGIWQPEGETTERKECPTTQQRTGQVLTFVTLWLTTWSGDISSKEKRIFYLSPILLFMSFMAYPPQILSLAQVACLWTRQWERERENKEVKEQREGLEGGVSLAARKSYKFVRCVCVSCLVCCCSGSRNEAICMMVAVVQVVVVAL